MSADDEKNKQRAYLEEKIDEIFSMNKRAGILDESDRILFEDYKLSQFDHTFVANNIFIKKIGSLIANRLETMDPNEEVIDVETSKAISRLLKMYAGGVFEAIMNICLIPTNEKNSEGMKTFIRGLTETCSKTIVDYLVTIRDAPKTSDIFTAELVNRGRPPEENKPLDKDFDFRKLI